MKPNECPTITVSIACYNVRKFLSENIGYVLSQSYSNLEIILVNDGSTDGSGELCDEIAQKDPRVKVIHKENGGLGSARNASLDNATGDYIYFFDIDDRIDLDLIERICNLAEKERAEIVVFGFDVYDTNSGTMDQNRFPNKLITSNEELKSIFCEEIFFKKHGNGFVWNKFYKRSFILKNEIRFGNERIQQDEPFNLRLYQKVERLLLTSQSGYHYYLDTNNSTGVKYVDRKFEAVTSVFDSLKSFYQDWNLNDKRFLDAAYKRYRGALLNVVCYNYFHKDCPLMNAQKRERITRICRSPQFEECSSYLVGDRSLDQISSLFWYCLRKEDIRLLMLLNGLLIGVKKIIK